LCPLPVGGNNLSPQIPLLGLPLMYSSGVDIALKEGVVFEDSKILCDFSVLGRKNHENPGKKWWVEVAIRHSSLVPVICSVPPPSLVCRDSEVFIMKLVWMQMFGVKKKYTLDDLLLVVQELGFYLLPAKMLLLLRLNREYFVEGPSQEFSACDDAHPFVSGENLNVCALNHTHVSADVIRPIYYEAFYAGIRSRKSRRFIDDLFWLNGDISVPYVFGKYGVVLDPLFDVPLICTTFSNINNMYEPVVCFGSKILFWTSAGYYLFKDKHKPLDMLGGKLDPGEAPYDCLLREAHEEAPSVDVSGASLITISGKRESGVHWLTFLFVRRGRPRASGFHFFSSW